MPTNRHEQLRHSWQPEPEADTERSARLHNADLTGNNDHLPTRDRNWLARFTAAENFSHTHNKPPKEKSDDPEEASTANWLRRQRSSLDRLCLYQIDLLNTLPAFEWEPRYDRTALMRQQLEAFITREGRSPRRRSDDREERSIARWRGARLDR